MGNKSESQLATPFIFLYMFGFQYYILYINKGPEKIGGFSSLSYGHVL